MYNSKNHSKFLLNTDGYFISTIGEVSSETLKNYIQNQG
ncbi:MAG: transposase [Clostridium sp.]|nr:transposase [Clostridium sp.]MCE5222041.1 transposase [Clostridium sp.]